ncbi:hypothetical protein [Amycolatopsis sp. YIM 10]|uniref:hypothetical protein n=1 Tax=Amycolatopsis sp. YIM 10 TaxID=2653857 RepID=UPI001290352F|nr:hypothetical protein [Amycolatopsis sp. YIM 10]QFU87868.1 hypothetical protein YIM_13410 [Amycolatopsis sp. YIM 10]QFU94819.1 hypothetical protein YIM_48470 [Amycolatopsis sp. YIM 10]
MADQPPYELHYELNGQPERVISNSFEALILGAGDFSREHKDYRTINITDSDGNEVWRP